MLDDEDFDFALLASPNWGGLAGIIVIIVLFLIGLAIWFNEEDCSQKICPTSSTPDLIHGQCLCITKAKNKLK